VHTTQDAVSLEEREVAPDRFSGDAERRRDVCDIDASLSTNLLNDELSTFYGEHVIALDLSLRLDANRSSPKESVSTSEKSRGHNILSIPCISTFSHIME